MHRAVHATADGPRARAELGRNDDRVLVDEAIGLFAVADGSGPFYGGYHEPIALDAALVLFRQRYASARADAAVGAERALAEALAAASAYLAGLDRRWTEVLKRLGPGLESSLAAGQEVAASIGLCAEGHVCFLYSLTAVAVAPDGRHIAVGQVGSGRAHRVAPTGSVEPLILDHTLRTLMPDSDHRDVCTRLLGDGRSQPDLASFVLSPGERLLLASDGCWQQPGALTQVMAAASQGRAALQQVLDGCAQRDDVTAIVVEIDAAR